MLREIIEDDVLEDRVLIAEPWDIGRGGYQLGNFPPPFLEWNDRYRDDIRRFWRGDRGMVDALATRIAGSSDIFASHGMVSTRSVNFVAAHDGMTLADVVSYERKHNEAMARTTATDRTRISPGTTARKASPRFPTSWRGAGATCGRCSPHSSFRAAPSC